MAANLAIAIFLYAQERKSNVYNPHLETARSGFGIRVAIRAVDPGNIKRNITPHMQNSLHGHAEGHVESPLQMPHPLERGKWRAISCFVPVGRGVVISRTWAVYYHTAVYCSRARRVIIALCRD